MIESKLTGKLTPLGDRVLVKQDEADDNKETKGGILIPDAAKEKPLTGTVIDVGKGRRLNDGKLLPVDLQAGDRVYFGKYAGVEVELNGETVVLLHEDEIYGVFNKNE